MSIQPNRRVALTFLAHPDDAEFNSAGTLIRLVEAGWEVHIATTANGDCGSMTLPRAEIAAVRLQEGINAAAKIGATYHCLGESDLEVVFDKPTNRKSIDLFRQVAPSLVITHPRFDYMSDHEQTHLLARSAAFAYPVPNSSSLPRLEGSALPWLYYCDPVDCLDPYTGEAPTPTTLVDVTAQMEQKLEMLACHASQRDWLRAHHGMDEYLESARRASARRGAAAGVKYAEAFVQHRGHAFPESDLLSDLFS